MDPVPHGLYVAVPTMDANWISMFRKMFEDILYDDFAWSLSDWGSLKPWARPF